MVSYRQKLQFWLKFSGWFCLIPASVYLYLFNSIKGSPFASYMMGEVIIIVLFGVYLLTTAKTKRWEKPSNIVKLLVFAFIFVAIIEVIPLFVAYLNCRKLQRNSK